MHEYVEHDPTLSSGVVERVTADGVFAVRIDDVVRSCRLGKVLRRIGVSVGEGDRVTVRAGEGDALPGEIMQFRPPLPVAEPAPAPRRSLLTGRTPVQLRPEDQRLDRSVRPGWPTGAECLPHDGDEVHCTAGPGTILHVLGRTGNGSRLLEIRLAGKPRTHFFAAASNVLVAPGETAAASR